MKGERGLWQSLVLGVGAILLAVAILPCRAAAQPPTVNGLFEGDGDYLKYSLYAENPGRARL